MAVSRPDSGERLLTTYLRLWGVQQALVLAFGGLVSRWDQAQAALVLAAAVSGWPPVAACALAVRVISNLALFPFAWESHYWCAQTDLALLVALLIAGFRARTLNLPPNASDAALADGARTIRWQMVAFYSSAAFWKANTSFLNASYSCAPIYMAQLLVGYAPRELASSHAAAAVLRATPAVVFWGEVVLAAAMLIAAVSGGADGGSALARRSSALCVLLALLLHLGIALTPPPNNVGAFSVMMAVRLVAFAPSAVARRLRLPGTATEALEVGGALAIAAWVGKLAAAVSSAGGDGLIASEARALARAGGAGAGAEAGTGAGAGQLGVMFVGGLDWSVPTFVLMALLLGRALASPPRARITEATAAEQGTRGAAKAGRAKGGARCTAANDTTLSRCACVGLFALAAVHSFVLPVFGLMDLGTSNMYSNLKLHGGSNHWLAPTGLLQALAYAHAHPSSVAPVVAARFPALVAASSALSSMAAAALPAAASTMASSMAASAFGGGVVRVELCNSSALQPLFPGEISDAIAPRARALLRQACGHSGRQWNAGMGVVLGSHVMPARAPSSRSSAYTVPALQLRRMLADAREEATRTGSRGFACAFSTLQGSAGAEAWWLGADAGEGASSREQRAAASDGVSAPPPLVLVTDSGHAGSHAGGHAGGLRCRVLPGDSLAAARASAEAALGAAGGGVSHAEVEAGVLAALAADERGVPCGAEELPMLPPLRPLERLLGVWLPYPIVEGMTAELHCFGP